MRYTRSFWGAAILCLYEVLPMSLQLSLAPESLESRKSINRHASSAERFSLTGSSERFFLLPRPPRRLRFIPNGYTDWEDTWRIRDKRGTCVRGSKRVQEDLRYCAFEESCVHLADLRSGLELSRYRHRYRLCYSLLYKFFLRHETKTSLFSDLSYP
jgi:hypothetical protein